jgi:hypothetical protein
VYAVSYPVQAMLAVATAGLAVAVVRLLRAFQSRPSRLQTAVGAAAAIVSGESDR